jgi:hypothetical protein
MSDFDGKLHGAAFSMGGDRYATSSQIKARYRL